jgi:2-oxoglutarate dehydrogenase E2 component (dihydrolipoamide succinyltransferase)
MSIEVKIPSVGESITSGVLSIWHKKTGDMVREGEALFTLETDKISTEIPAGATGKLQIQVDAGQEVKIGEVVASLDESAKPSTQDAKPPAQDAKPAAPSVVAEAPAPRGESNQTLSPAARRIVEEEKVNVAEVAGTGKRGQLTKSDLVQYLESKSAPPSSTQPSPQKQTAAPDSPVPAKAPTPSTARTTRRKMTPLRKKIAAQLVLAQQNASLVSCPSSSRRW